METVSFAEIITKLAEGEQFEAVKAVISFDKDGLKLKFMTNNEGMAVADIIHNLKEEEILNAVEPVKDAMVAAADSITKLIVERHPNAIIEKIEKVSAN